ncbi:MULTISPECIES: DUF4238 domain-containing protein [Shewanella]|uniref:DUF4238 domain-containing protein n=1 Tax=Shewanella TaxID=22 RepID=UPI0006457C33|nr:MULTISPECIES: DUF4238 domain-containing protein [Shewanella]MCT8868780.1 DUF4238 domain-containing protein [Shewanella xiamenensis]
MSNPKNHHYVPQSYQLLFSLDGKNLFYLDKKKSQILGPAGPRNFCSENFLYSLTGETAKASNSPTFIENPMLSTIDGAFASEVEKLMSENPDKTDVSLYNLSMFFGFLSARNPRLINKFQSDFDRALIGEILKHARVDEAAKKKAENMGLDLNDDSLFEGLSFSESRNMTLIKMVENAQKNAVCIHDCMGWLFFYSFEADILLCDDPFIVKDDAIEIEQLLSSRDDYFILVPLSRQLCLCLSSHKSEIKHTYINSTQARVINNLIINNAERWVIGPSKKSIQGQ